MKKTVFKILNHGIMKRQADKERPVTAFTLLLMLAFGFLFWLHYRSIEKAKLYSDWEKRTNDVIRLNNDLFITMLEAETGQRGFVITGDEKFLRPYIGTKRKAYACLKALREATKDNYIQRRRVDTLYSLCMARFIFLGKGVIYRQANQKDKAIAFVGDEQSNDLLEKLRITVNAFNTEEQKLLRLRSEGSVKETKISFRTLFVGTTIILILVIGLYYSCIRLINKLRGAQMDLFISYELFSQTLLSVGDAAIATDAAGNITFMNKVAEEITGKSMARFMGRPIEMVCDVVNEKTRLPVENPVRETLRENKKTALANYQLMLKKEGDYYYIDNSVAPIQDDDGEIIGAVLVFRDVTEKSVNLQKLQAAHQEIKSKNKSITDSILYAKSIQEAMLPKAESLTRLFPQSFIMYMPKDIVSGDFYWLEEQDNKLIVAVADCTGHGVPGALMAMIGYSLLNEIVTRNKIIEPHDILKNLHDGIRRVLQAGIIENQMNDGMDIATCVIDRTKQTLAFAGANRPLFFFKDGGLTVVKGNTYGVGGIQLEIGGIQLETKREYTTHRLSYTSSDTIYMFTDGYQDQFGGSKDKKMMVSAVTSILKSVQGAGIAEQESIIRQQFDQWRGDGEQTDDVLFVGIRLEPLASA